MVLDNSEELRPTGLLARLVKAFHAKALGRRFSRR